MICSFYTKKIFSKLTCLLSQALPYKKRYCELKSHNIFFYMAVICILYCLGDFIMFAKQQFLRCTAYSYHNSLRSFSSETTSVLITLSSKYKVAISISKRAIILTIHFLTDSYYEGKHFIHCQSNIYIIKVSISYY